MIDIFDRNCAMVSKTGVSDQCSALNGKFNPKADARKKLMEIRMAREAESANRQKLLDLRFNLCSSINLLQTEGKDLHEVFFKLGNMVNEAYVETNKTNINRVMSDLRELNNEEPRSKLRGICVRIGSSKAAKYTKPSSPEQAPRYSGSPNKDIQYNAYVEDNGNTFMHFAAYPDEQTLIIVTELPAFKRFQQELKASDLINPPKSEHYSLVASSII